MLKTIFLFLSIFFTLACVAQAQDADAQDTMPGAQHEREDMGKPTEEIIKRAEIRHEEETHKEMVDRAGEAAQIGGEILNDYKKNSALSGDDFKKLDRLDKLAHKIRGSAGASEDVELQDPPSKLEDAVKRLADASDLLNKSVQKTSRMVISAAVIDHSNELIGLIKRIRNIQHP
jgi:HPt (histidine-containing phosphotransfer) domain-containing protein